MRGRHGTRWGRRPASSALWILQALLGGCTGSEPYLEVPRLDDQSLLIARVGPGLELAGYELGAEPYLGVPLTGFEELYVARYRCPLLGLGMAPGPQQVGRNDDYSPIPPSPRVSMARLGLSGLEDLPDWPEALASLRVKRAPDPAPCLNFDVSTFPVVSASPNPFRVLLRVGPERAVLWQNQGGAFELDPAGVRPFTRLSTTTPYLGGAIDRTGRILLTGAGRSSFLTQDGAWTPGPPLPDDSPSFQNLAYDPAGDLDDVFLIGDGGRLFHFNGVAWSALPVESQVFDNDRYFTVIRRGPGRAAAVGLLPDAIVTWDNGRADTLRLPPLEVGDHPVVIAEPPGIGLVVGTKQGVLFFRDGESWVRLESGFGSRPRHFLPFQDTLIFGGRSGVFEQYYPGYGLCPTTPIASDNTTLVADVDGLLMMVTLGAVGNEEAVVVARPRERPAPGCPNP